MSPKNKIPDRWFDYTKMGAIVENSRFLPIKVPLKETLTMCYPEEDRFSPDHVLQMAQCKCIKIGLVIDLTFTTRYYSPDKFTSLNIAYTKIFMPGHIIPSKAIIEKFYEAVSQFERDNAGNEHVILIHCTHGVNRTGYMICKYLIEHKNLTPDQAIAAFSHARGHNIEREVYLNDLHSSSTQTFNVQSRITGQRDFTHDSMHKFHAFSSDKAFNMASSERHFNTRSGRHCSDTGYNSRPPFTHPRTSIHNFHHYLPRPDIRDVDKNQFFCSENYTSWNNGLRSTPMYSNGIHPNSASFGYPVKSPMPQHISKAKWSQSPVDPSNSFSVNGIQSHSKPYMYPAERPMMQNIDRHDDFSSQSYSGGKHRRNQTNPTEKNNFRSHSARFHHPYRKSELEYNDSTYHHSGKELYSGKWNDHSFTPSIPKTASRQTYHPQYHNY